MPWADVLPALGAEGPGLTPRFQDALEQAAYALLLTGRTDFRVGDQVRLDRRPPSFDLLPPLLLRQVLLIMRPRHARNVPCRTLGSTRAGAGIGTTG